MKNIRKVSLLYIAVVTIALLGMLQLFHEESYAIPTCSSIWEPWCAIGGQAGWCPDINQPGPNCVDNCGYIVNICQYCLDQCNGPIDPR